MTLTKTPDICFLFDLFNLKRKLRDKDKTKNEK